jgi:hypothetical protein
MKEQSIETLANLRGADRLGNILAPCRSTRTFHIIFKESWKANSKMWETPIRLIIFAPA